MVKRSRFKSFILSMFPGVGHIYIGFTSRGLIFLGTMLAIIFTLQFMEPVRFNNGLFNFQILNGYRHVLEFAIPLVWFFSVIDNFILTSKLNRGAFQVECGEGFQTQDLDKILEGENRRLLSVILNIVPGAGHLFLGYKDKGIQIAGLFFLIYTLGQFIGLDILNFAAALIWIYCILDILLSNGSNEKIAAKNELTRTDFNNTVLLIKGKLHWIGCLLIFIGIMTLINRFVSELIDENVLRQIAGYVKDGLISVIFIGLGIKLLYGKKKNLIPLGGDK